MAYVDARYGAPFGIVVALLVAFATYGAYAPQTVLGWLAFTIACNVLRLITRTRYLRNSVPIQKSLDWERLFVVVSAASGLSWGVGAWLFY
jgi:O-antigen ligase